MEHNLKFSVLKNYSLHKLLLMRINVVARYYINVEDPLIIPELFEWIVDNGLDYFILGGGSNSVFINENYNGVVIHINIDIEDVSYLGSNVLISKGAGCNWDDFVAQTVEDGFWGLENLSLIPGSVGAVAVQNVGAYGQEVKNVIESVSVYNIVEKKFEKISNSDCNFRFRESIFNTIHAGMYLILSIDFKLSTEKSPILSRYELKKSIINLSDKNLIGEIRKKIVEIRSSGRMLPKPASVGNCGTFFRAQVIAFSNLPRIITYNLFRGNFYLIAQIAACAIKFKGKNGFKLPSRVLIEYCFNDYPRVDGFTLFSNNPAVLINDGADSTPTSLNRLIKLVENKVKQKTGIEIVVEPVIVNNT